MQESAITHSIGRPQACLRFAEISSAVALAIAMVNPSSDSRTPPYLPSIVGRMPTLGNEPRRRFVGGLGTSDARSAMDAILLRGLAHAKNLFAFKKLRQ